MRYVIIGNGAAGNAAARTIAAKDPAGQIIMISDEPHEAYYRPLIPNLIDEAIDKTILFHEVSAEIEGIEKRLGEKVKEINPQGKFITLEGDEQISFDRLLIAAGSSAIRPSIPNMDADGVHTLRTLDDAEAIKNAVEGTGSALVIGAGRVGMKAASALKHKGLDVTVVEMLEYVVPLQFDKVAGELVGLALESQGIKLILGQGVKGVIKSEGRATGIELEDGRELEAQLTLVATGVAANTELAKAAGIAVNRGVLVDEFMRTNIPDVYAAGDVVETSDIVTGEQIVSGLWTNAVEMGNVAGSNMVGEEARYEGAFSILNSLEIANTPTVSVGTTNPPPGQGFEVRSHRWGDNYRKLVLKNGVLVGALVVGDIEGAGVYTGLIKRKVEVDPFMDVLMARKPSYAPWMRGEIQPGIQI